MRNLIHILASISMTILAGFFLAANIAFAEKETKAANLAADTPMTACRTIVQKTVEKDFEAVKALSLRPDVGMHGKKPANLDKKSFAKMHEDRMGELKNLTCVREVVADDHAFVETKSEGESRLIPFVKKDDVWKFDSGAYMAFYDTSAKTRK